MVATSIGDWTPRPFRYGDYRVAGLFGGKLVIMMRLAAIAFLCTPLIGQNAEFQKAIQDMGSPEFQKAVLRAEARAGIWVASLDQSQQLIFSPATVRSFVLNISMGVRDTRCKTTLSISFEPPHTICGPSSVETSDLQVTLGLRRGSSRVGQAPDPPLPESERVGVAQASLVDDQIQFSGKWSVFSEVKRIVPVTVNARFSPDGSQLIGTMICDDRSISVIFERLNDSGDPLSGSGDWINWFPGISLFHIRRLGLGTDELVSTLDHVLSDQAWFGRAFKAEKNDGGVLLCPLDGYGGTSFFAREYGDGKMLKGEWRGNSPAGGAFWRLNPAQ